MKKLLLTILFFAAVWITIQSPASAEEYICDYCKDQIKGKYLEADGKFYHPIHFICDNCRKTIGHGSYFRKNGKHYCESCFDDLFMERCGYCELIVQDLAVIYDGMHFHDTCFPKYREIEEGKYPRCDYCSEFIKTPYEITRSTYDDGRHVCSDCRRTAVRSDAQADKLLEEARQRLAQAGIEINDDNLFISLVSKDELLQLSLDKIADRDGLVIFQRWSDGLGSSTTQYEIFVLYGIPEKHFMMTAAHELMHVWQYSHSIEEKNLAFSEGSCNYAAYLVLKQLPGDLARLFIDAMEEDPDPNYGEGFRRVKKLVKEKGQTVWLNHLKNNLDFPPGY